MTDTNSSVYTKQQLIDRLKEVDTLPISDRAVSIMMPVSKFLAEIEKDKTPFVTLMNWASIIGLTFQVGAPMNKCKKQIKVNSTNYLQEFRNACDKRRKELLTNKTKDAETVFSQVLDRTIAQRCAKDEYFETFFNDKLSYKAIMQMAVGLEINMEVEPGQLIKPVLTEEEQSMFGVEEKIRDFCLEKKLAPIWICNQEKFSKLLQNFKNNIEEASQSFDSSYNISEEIIVRPLQSPITKDCYTQLFLFFAYSYLHNNRECMIGRIMTNKYEYHMKVPTIIDVRQYGGLHNALNATITIIKDKIESVAEFAQISKKEIYEYMQLPKALIQRLENNENLIFDDIVILTALFAVNLYANYETCSTIYKQIEQAIEEYQLLLLDCKETENKPIPEADMPAIPEVAPMTATAQKENVPEQTTLSTGKTKLATEEIKTLNADQQTTESDTVPKPSKYERNKRSQYNQKNKKKESKTMATKNTTTKTDNEKICILENEHFKEHILLLNQYISSVPVCKDLITVAHTQAVANCFHGIMAAIYDIEPDQEFTYKEHQYKLDTKNGIPTFVCTQDNTDESRQLINDILHGNADVKDIITGPFQPKEGDVYFTLNIMSGDIMKCVYGNNPQCDNIAGSPFGIGYFRTEIECKKKAETLTNSQK